MHVTSGGVQLASCVEISGWHVELHPKLHDQRVFLHNTVASDIHDVISIGNFILAKDLTR